MLQEIGNETGKGEEPTPPGGNRSKDVDKVGPVEGEAAEDASLSQLVIAAIIIVVVVVVAGGVVVFELWVFDGSPVGPL